MATATPTAGTAAGDDNVVNLVLLPDPSEDDVRSASEGMRVTRQRTQSGPSFELRQRARQLQHLACLEDAARRRTVHTLVLKPTAVALEWGPGQAEILQRALVACAACLVHLDLQGDPHVCNMALPESVTLTVARDCPKLRFLNALGSPWTAEGLETLARTATSLRCLRLGGISVAVRRPLPADDLRHLASLTQLRELCIRSTGITDGGLVAIVRGGGAHLTHLDLACSDQLTEDSIAVVAESCPCLVAIDLLNCQSVGASGIRALGAHCHELVDVNLQRVPGATAGVQALCTGCPGLTQLVLSVCTLLDEDLDAICSGLPALDTLDLNGVRGPSPKSYMQLGRLQSLRSVELNGLRLPSDKMLQVCTAIAEGCPQLEHLGLNNSTASRACVAVVQAALPHCRIATIHCTL